MQETVNELTVRFRLTVKINRALTKDTAHNEQSTDKIVIPGSPCQYTS